MDWLDHHRETERLSFRAAEARRANDSATMSRLLLAAAASEEQALNTLNSSQPITWDTTAISIASLYLQARDLDMAEKYALRFLLSEEASESARIRLRDLLGLIWAERRRTDNLADEHQEAVIVELDSSDEPSFGIPLNIMISSAQHLKTSIYRTAELRKALPFVAASQRKWRHADICDLKILGIDEYGDHYSVLIQEPGIWQPTFADAITPEPMPLVQHFFDIADAAIESPSDGLPDLIPDPAYREGVLKSFHALAPGGRTVEHVSIYSDDESRGIDLDQDIKRDLLLATRQLCEQELSSAPKTGTIHGTLIGFDLADGSIKVHSDSGERHIVRVGKTVVAAYLEQIENREVEVHVAEDKAGQLLFRGLIPNQ